MKKIFLILTTALLIISCKNTDKAGVMDNQQSEIDSLKLEMSKQKAELAKQKTVDSMNSIMAAQAAQNRRNVQAAQNASVNNNATPEAKKKGWSGAAKGAVIGAGVGAVSGAVIAKKRKGEGAVIGGLAGAALGAGTGAVIDADKKKKEEVNK